MYNINLTHSFFPDQECIICNEKKKSQIILEIYEEKDRKYEVLLCVNVCSVHIFSLYTSDVLQLNQDNFTLHETINFLTETSTSERVCNNTFQNISQLSEYKTIKNYFSKFENYSCALIGAGPTLDEVLPVLDKIKDKIIIISCMPAVNSLLAYEIKPDFIFSIDSSKLNFMHTENADIKDIPCVLDISVDIQTFEKCKNNLILAEMLPQTFNNALNVLKDYIEDLGRLESGCTVFTSMLSFALQSKFSNIITFGFDCAILKNKTHSEGYSLAKLISDENYEFIETTSISENETHTSPAFLSQAHMISNILIENKKEIFCTSPIFPKVKNVTFLDSEKENLISKFQLQDKKEYLKVISENQIVYKIDRSKLRTAFIELNKNLSELTKETDNLLSYVKKNYLEKKEFQSDTEMLFEAENIIVRHINETTKEHTLADFIDNYMLELNKYMELTEKITDDILANKTRNLKRGLIYLSTYTQKIEILKDFLLKIIKSIYI